MAGKVLVVDDASATRRVVNYVLRSIDVESVEAINGMEALDLAQTEQFGMVLVDINLPDIDGFEVIRRLNDITTMRDVPKVIFTARNEPQDKRQAIAVGAIDFLYKPFSTQELREMVAGYLGLS